MAIAPYDIYKERQCVINSQQSRIDELQQQIAELKEHIPAELNITSSVSSSPTVYSPNTADVTITVRPEPPYSNTITQTIQNPSPKYFIYEVVRFKTSKGFKFAPMAADIKLPEYFIIQKGYEDTDNMTLIVKDYSPLASYPLPLKVYTFDSSMEGTENITTEILVKGIEKSIE